MKSTRFTSIYFLLMLTFISCTKKDTPTPNTPSSICSIVVTANNGKGNPLLFQYDTLGRILRITQHLIEIDPERNDEFVHFYRYQYLNDKVIVRYYEDGKKSPETELVQYRDTLLLDASGRCTNYNNAPVYYNAEGHVSNIKVNKWQDETICTYNQGNLVLEQRTNSRLTYDYYTDKPDYYRLSSTYHDLSISALRLQLFAPPLGKANANLLKSINGIVKLSYQFDNENRPIRAIAVSNAYTDTLIITYTNCK